MADNKEKLFAQFPPVSYDTWRAKVDADLKGVPFEKKLVWRTNEGFNVQPMYQRADIADLPTVNSLPGEYPYVRGTRNDNNWLTRQEILPTDPAKANAVALDVLGKGVNSLGFKVKEPSAEAVATMLKGIDLKTVEINFTTCPRKALDLARILVAYIKENDAADDFRGSITLLGKIFGKETRAAELLSFVESETAELGRRTADIAEDAKPSVYVCGLGNWGTTNHLMTVQDYSTFRVAHIKNAVSGLSASGIQPIEAEKFTALGADMDIMLIDAAAVKNIKPLYAEDSGMFDSCKAWQNGQVYLEMAYNAYYTNYEIALANAWFAAKCAYPDQFADIDMTEKLNEITGAFLGKGIAEDICRMPNSFGGYQQIDTAAFFR